MFDKAQEMELLFSEKHPNKENKPETIVFNNTYDDHDDSNAVSKFWSWLADKKREQAEHRRQKAHKEAACRTRERVERNICIHDCVIDGQDVVALFVNGTVIEYLPLCSGDNDPEGLPLEGSVSSLIRRMQALRQQEYTRTFGMEE